MNLAIDVCILTRERPDDLSRLLSSLEREIQPHDHILVLENGGTSFIDSLAERHQRVVWYRTAQNLGVAGGRNWLMDKATAPVIVFLDDDLEVLEGALDIARTTIEENAQTAVLALNVVTPDRITSRRAERPARGKLSAERPSSVSYFLGGACAARRQALMSVGGLDARLFFALEELDLSFRLIQAGWELLYEPRARVVHHASTIERSPERHVYYNLRNRFRVAFRNLPIRYALTHAVLWSSYFAIYGVRHRVLRSYAKGLADGLSSVPSALRERRPLRNEAIAYLRSSHGRLFY